MSGEKDNSNIFASLITSLENEGVEYILVGGYAVVLHGSSRFTEDIDVFIKRNEENIERLRRALRSISDDDSIKEITLKEIEDYSVLRYIGDNGLIVDIIGNLGEAFTYENIESERVEYLGREISIATLNSLYKLKANTYREIDQEDLLFIQGKLKEKNNNG